jgi:hypothetical protein
MKLAKTFGLEVRSTYLGLTGIDLLQIEIDVHSDTGHGQCDSHEAPRKAWWTT